MAAQTSPPAPTENEQDDTALTKLLTGRWESKEYIAYSWWDQKASYAQSHTFSGIGTFTAVGTVSSWSAPTKSYNLSGSWQIRDKRLYREIERSDIPDRIPEGLKGACPIIRLTSDEFVFEDSVLGGLLRHWNRQAGDN